MTRKVSHLAKSPVPWKIPESCHVYRHPFLKYQSKIQDFQPLLSEMLLHYLDHEF